MLHDRDELLALVEQLVGLELREDRHPRNSRKGTPPVVLAQGRRGSGKSAALDEIFAAYRNRVPEARLDLASERYAAADGAGRAPGLPLLRWRDEWPASRQGTGHPGWDTPLLRLLRDAKWELELHIPDNGRLRFPRLDVAQLALASWQREWKPDTEITVAQARHQLNRAREAVGGKDKAEHEMAVEWIADVLSEFSGTTVGFPADVFVKATVSAFLQRTLPGLGRTLTVLGKSLTRRGPDVPVKWHEQFDRREPGDGYDALITLARDWSAPGHRRRHEQRLVSAFLADLGAEYTGLAGMNRAVPPLVLLDNADASPAGERFLALARTDRARAKGDGDPLILVAVAPETFRLPGASGALMTGSPAGAAAGPVTGRDAGQLARRVALTPLADDAVDRELGQANSFELPPDFPLLIHRLTGGLPQGVRALAQAVAGAVPAHPPPGGQARAVPLRGADLLDLRAAPGDARDGPGDSSGGPGDAGGEAGEGRGGPGDGRDGLGNGISGPGDRASGLGGAGAPAHDADAAGHGTSAARDDANGPAYGADPAGDGTGGPGKGTGGSGDGTSAPGFRASGPDGADLAGHGRGGPGDGANGPAYGADPAGDDAGAPGNGTGALGNRTSGTDDGKDGPGSGASRPGDGAGAAGNRTSGTRNGTSGPNDGTSRPGQHAGGSGDGADAPGGGTRFATARAKRGGATIRPSVAALLLERLIPDDVWRSRLALLSCARDDAEARALLAPLTPADRVRFAVSDAEELLEENDWLDPRPPAGRESCRCAPPGAGYFIGDAFLRTLLRHQLAATGGQAAAAAAHVTLRDLYGEAGTGLLASTEPPRLYHCLALGEAGYVTGRLHAAFAGSDPQAWLAALVHAAAAPHPRAAPRPAGQAAGGGDDPRREVALGGGDAAAPTSDPVYLSVNRLLHAAWYLHDPLVSPEGAAEEVIETLAGELRSLARTHPRGYGVLFRASRGWPRRLRAWDQSYCPTTEGE